MAYLGFAGAGSSGGRRFASRSGASTSVATTQRSPGRPEPSAVVTTPRRPCAVFWTEHVGSAFSAVPADRQVIRRDPREVSLAPTRTLQHPRCVHERAPREPAGPDRRFPQTSAAPHLTGP